MKTKKELIKVGILFSIIAIAGLSIWYAKANYSSKAKPINEAGLVGYWNFDDCDVDNPCTTVKDLSGNGNEGTFQATAITTASGKVGNAGVFDGDSDFVLIPHNASLNPETTYTLSAWVNTNSVSGYHAILTKDGYSGTKAYYMDFSGDSIRFGYANGAAGDGITDSRSLSTGTWYHVVGTYDGSNIVIYIDGVPSSPSAKTWTSQSTNTANFHIGKMRDGATEYWDGMIDEARIYNRALSAAEVGALYRKDSGKFKTKTKTISENGLVGYWNFDDCDVDNTCSPNVKDLSGNDNDGTFNGTASTIAGGKVGNAVIFDGNSDYVSVDHDSSLDITTDITVSAWIKVPSPSAYYERILWKFYRASAGNNGGYGMQLRDSGVLQAELWNNSAGYAVYGTKVLDDGVWHHVVMTWTPGTNVKLYADGIEEATSVTGSAPATIKSTSQPLEIGRLFYQGTYYYGDISVDEARVYSRVLTAEEINTLYRQGLGKFKTTTKPVSEKGLVGYWNFDDCDVDKTCSPNVKDLSGNGNDGTFNGHASTTASGKIGNGGVFDGVVDYINAGSDASLDIQGNVTVAVWVRLADTPENYSQVADKQSTTGYSLIVHSDRKVQFWISDGGWDGLQDAATALQDGIWYHIAGVYDGQIHVFVNGVEEGTPVAQGAPSSCAACDFIIGYSTYHSNRDFNGKIDEVRTYNRALSAVEIDALYRQGR